MSGQQTVAVLGTGTMGFPMARNLARAGFPVRVWNRSRDKAEPLAKDGVQVCDTPAQAGDGASVILTMLAEGLGLDPQLFLDAVSGGTLDLPYLQIKSKAIISQDFTPAFRLALAAKDAALVAEAAERHHIDVPLTRLLRDRLAEGAREHGDKDMAATYLTSAPRRDTP